MTGSMCRAAAIQTRVRGPRWTKWAAGALALIQPWAAPSLAKTPWAPPPSSPAPIQIHPEDWGKPSFAENFRRFDHGVDQDKPRKPHRWRMVYGYGGANRIENRTLPDNHEDQIYMDPAYAGLKGCSKFGIDPFAWKPGQLSISADRLNDTQAFCLERRWSSGLITTRWSFSQAYGYFEADIAIPGDAGFWPAFWLLPASGKWPLNGEIDMLEAVGPHTPDGKLRPHVGVIFDNSGKRSGAGGFIREVDTGPHKYGVLWTRDTINFYLDRTLVSSTVTPKGVDTPMYMLLNLAVGGVGSWPGLPLRSQNHAAMVIRSVTAWPISSIPESSIK